MKRSILGALLLALVFTGSVAAMGGQMPMGGPGGEGEKPSGSSPVRGMMCPVTGSDMEPMGMTAMMAGGQMDPKAMGRMLELRGEILKAIGDVLVKHGQAMRQEP